MILVFVSLTFITVFFFMPCLLFSCPDFVWMSNSSIIGHKRFDILSDPFVLEYVKPVSAVRDTKRDLMINILVFLYRVDQSEEDVGIDRG